MSHRILKEQEVFSAEMNHLWYEASDEKAVLSQMLQTLMKDRHFDKIIDVGAGPGLLAQPLYERCQQLTLLDLLPIYQEELIQKFPKAKVVIAPLETFPYEQYDIILFSHVLYYIHPDKWLETTEKFYNHTSENGSLIVILGDVRWIFDLFQDKVGEQIDVYSIENKTFIQSVSHLGKVEVFPYSTITPLADDEATMIDYLSKFFRLEPDYLIKNCSEEIKQFQNRLHKVSGNYELLINGDVVVISRSQ